MNQLRHFIKDTYSRNDWDGYYNCPHCKERINIKDETRKGEFSYCPKCHKKTGFTMTL